MKKTVLSAFWLLVALFVAAPAMAQSAEEAAVVQAVELLRQAMFTKDIKGFEAMISENVSYGHSAGRIENKKEFILFPS